MTIRTLALAALSVAIHVACTDELPTAEVLPQSPVVDQPAAPGTPGKAGELGERPDVTGCPDRIIAAPSWPGEWPGPVIDVEKPVTVQARAEPCSSTSFDCTVPAGIYHPWSDIEAKYVTVRALDQWRVVKNIDEYELDVGAGDIIEVYQYFGEGYCGYRVAGKEVTELCPGELGDALEEIERPQVPERQLFSVACGSRTGWVEVNEALLALPEVREGTTPEYGKVGPGTE